MINQSLLRVSLRLGGVYLPDVSPRYDITASTLALVRELREAGFVVSEPLLHALNALCDSDKSQLSDVINDVMSIGLNWAPLVRGWLVPTGESFADHLLTALANVWCSSPDAPEIMGYRLPCGHLIPDGTFNMERYNGCPFCGRPFALSAEIMKGQGTKPRELTLWGEEMLMAHYRNLLESPVAIDATQADSVKLLLRSKPLPVEVKIEMKETLMLVAETLLETGNEAELSRLMTSPDVILRYLWYRHTGSLQIVRPSTLLRRAERSGRHHIESLDRSSALRAEEQTRLRLHYSRAWCRRVAEWINAMSIPPHEACEIMHPYRGMWVRMIRALRLPEYARKEGFANLRTLLDLFYRDDYAVWAGAVQTSMLRGEISDTLTLLRQRPGVMARRLFAMMLRFDYREVIKEFERVAHRLPPRLLLRLGSLAGNYFTGSGKRVVKPPMSKAVVVEEHPLLKNLSMEQRKAMAQAVERVYVDTMTRRFAMIQNPNRTMYIAPQLAHVPLAVGDRSTTIHDVNAALQGMRFPVEGDRVRLFMQWGKGMPADHIDMDLSAVLIDGAGNVDFCSYFKLTTAGAQHSGDIQEIPDQTGTAEYVELDLPVLQARGITHVAFCCNAYSDGMLNPNLVVGWMSCEHPMTVSDSTGVAYDPSTVQHQVRVTSGSDKGLVFGVLLVEQRTVVWLEIPLPEQNVRRFESAFIVNYLRQLEAKITIADLLRLKAQAQGLTIVENEFDADEAYTVAWATDPARVSKLLLG